jgi:Na+-translocating ferredoxin:NAD+ oxidoreductase RnfA subunit
MKEGKNMLEFSIITITAFVAMLNECVKLLAGAFNKNIDKFIPLFSIAFGIILGIVGYFLPNVDMGKNIVEAIFIGLSAGMASTGAHQVGKQLSKE